ncbi:hypothetical protein J0J30_23115, partial [Vibrio vulnificus]|nr:hypothetical protein [Vibrio vulnificus]
LIGSLLNYEIVIKSRGLKIKPNEKAKGIALKASIEEYDEQDDEGEDEECAHYARNVRKYKTLLEARKRDLKRDDVCFKCSRHGHRQRECRYVSSKHPQVKARGKIKE